MKKNTDFETTLITLEAVATLLDGVSIQLFLITGERDHRMDCIRCDLEDFREDLADIGAVKYKTAIEYNTEWEVPA